MKNEHNNMTKWEDAGMIAYFFLLWGVFWLLLVLVPEVLYIPAGMAALWIVDKTYGPWQRQKEAEYHVRRLREIEDEQRR